MVDPVALLSAVDNCPLLIAADNEDAIADIPEFELDDDPAGGSMTVVTIIDPVTTPTILTREVSLIARRAHRLEMNEDITVFV